jgi:hypothetical protein
MVCLHCGKTIGYEEKYCANCIDYLQATKVISYADLWKYKLSACGCIGCRFISTGEKCIDCTRNHKPAPPFVDCYEKS